MNKFIAILLAVPVALAAPAQAWDAPDIEKDARVAAVYTVAYFNCGKDQHLARRALTIADLYDSERQRALFKLYVEKARVELTTINPPPKCEDAIEIGDGLWDELVKRHTGVSNDRR